MKKIISTLIVLAMLTAIPLSAMAQEDPVDQPVEPGEPIIGITEPEPAPYYEPWYYWPEPSGFNYTDGVANGTYADFTLDEATGEIGDYTVKLVEYNYFYPMVLSDYGPSEGWDDEGNYYSYYMPEPVEHVVKLFDSVEFEDFVPNGHPVSFGETLYYLGENVMMSFYDYEWSSMNFQLGQDNSSVVFTVPDGAEISEIPYYYGLYDIQEDDWMDWEYSDNVDKREEAPLPPEDIVFDEEAGTLDVSVGGGVSYYEPWYWSWDEIWIKFGNVSCSLWVDKGAISVDGNEITVDTYPGAWLSTSAWIEYGWTLEYSEPWFGDDISTDESGALASALQEGLVAAVGYLFIEDNGGARYSDTETVNDPTFTMEFQNVEKNQFQIQVQSEIQEGRIVSVNLNKGALDAEHMNEVKVLLDEQRVRTCGSIEELTDMVGGTKAGYYMVFGETQDTLFVYVPHFSTHTITVGLAESLAGMIMLPGMAAFAFVAIAVAMVIRRGKKSRGEL